jgi:hypothetical protein
VTAEQSLQEALFRQLEVFVEPVTAAATNPGKREALLEAIGWDLAAISGFDESTLTAWLTQVEAVANGVRRIVESGGPRTLDELQAALETGSAAIGVVSNLPPALRGGLPAEIPVGQFAEDLITHLTITTLLRQAPVAYRVAVLLGLVTPALEAAESEPVPATGAPIRLSKKRPAIHPDRIGPLLSEPMAALRELYFPDGWQTSEDADEAADRLFPRIADLLTDLGMNASYSFKPAEGTNPAASRSPVANHTLSVSGDVPLGPVPAKVGASFALAPAGRGGLGLVVVPFGQLTFATKLERWRFELKVAGAGAAFAIGPAGLVVDAGGTTVDVGLETARIPDDKGYALLVGNTAGTHLAVGSIVLSLEAGLSTTRQDYGATISVSSAAFVLRAGEGDDFLKWVLPAEGVRVPFDLALGWSTAKGLHFRGAGGLEATLPVQAAIGPLHIPSVFVSLQASQDGVRLVLAASARLALGPVTATVERVGLEAGLALKPAGGNLGPLDGSLSFKPPNGVALSIAAGPVTGGGFLFCDPAKGLYAGAVHLDVQGISLNAVGLLTTPLPGGQPGFSLLVIITAQFNPIQLGFGFSLTGVGGVIGINRTVDVGVLRSGLKGGSLDCVLFQRGDPVPRAGEIVAALANVFPAAADRFVLGPMVQITWGTPTVVTMDVAVLMELPAPARIVVLGRIEVVLPPGVREARASGKEIEPLVNLTLDVLGEIDFKRKQVSVDAVLRNSTLMRFAVTGEMALRANWGDRPNFALAVGGLHPRFQAPPDFPKLDRVALTLASGDAFRFRLEAYFAVTANTVQFGANLDCGAKLADFTVELRMSFDALLQLSPFRFEADLAGLALIKHGSTNLMMAAVTINLAGPAPWTVRLCAVLVIGGVSIGPLNHTFTTGSPAAVDPPPTVNLWGLLEPAFLDPRNWSAHGPPGGPVPVTLRPAPSAPGTILASPEGFLAVEQRVLPLGRPLDFLGTAVPADHNSFAVTSVDVDGAAQSAAQGTSPVTSYFAPAQYWKMTDADKLARPSFEPFASGVKLTPPSQYGAAVELTISYDEVVVGADGKSVPQPATTPAAVPAAVTAALAETGAAARALATRPGGRGRFPGPRLGVSVADLRYVVAHRDNLAVVDPVGATGGTYTGAVEALRRRSAAAPGTANDFVVVAQHEVP